MMCSHYKDLEVFYTKQMLNILPNSWYVKLS